MNNIAWKLKKAGAGWGGAQLAGQPASCVITGNIVEYAKGRVLHVFENKRLTILKEACAGMRAAKQSQ
jgi:hypothetical protein